MDKERRQALKDNNFDLYKELYRSRRLIECEINDSVTNDVLEYMGIDLFTFRDSYRVTVNDNRW